MALVLSWSYTCVNTDSAKLAGSEGVASKMAQRSWEPRQPPGKRTGFEARGRETHGTGGEMREKDWLPREAQHGRARASDGAREKMCEDGA